MSEFSDVDFKIQIQKKKKYNKCNRMIFKKTKCIIILKFIIFLYRIFIFNTQCSKI